MLQTCILLLMSTMISCASARQTEESVATEKGTVLVVLSSVDPLELCDGQTYTTGFYLPGRMTPLQMLMDAGYGVEFTNPAGNVPSMDIVSDNSSYFGDVEGRATNSGPPPGPSTPSCGRFVPRSGSVAPPVRYVAVSPHARWQMLSPAYRRARPTTPA